MFLRFSARPIDRVTDIVVVNIDVNVDKLERKVGELDRKLGGGRLTQSSTTDLTTT